LGRLGGAGLRWTGCGATGACRRCGSAVRSPDRRGAWRIGWKHLEAEIAKTTRTVFDEPATSRDMEPMLRQLGGIGGRLGGLHNAGQRRLRLAIYLDGAAPAWFGDHAAKRIGLLHKDLATLGEFEQHLDERVELLLDSVLGMINMDPHNVMKVMALASVVGIPPTVLVGIWGMNFAHMSELKWHRAYYWALGAIALSVVLPRWPGSAAAAKGVSAAAVGGCCA
jgi:magnesium transporter